LTASDSDRDDLMGLPPAKALVLENKKLSSDSEEFGMLFAFFHLAE
jgi:hypothetical protein